MHAAQGGATETGAHWLKGGRRAGGRPGGRAPLAAEMPCSVERYLVVNSSTGVMNVVALGPKLAKKNVSACAAPGARLGQRAGRAARAPRRRRRHTSRAGAGLGVRRACLCAVRDQPGVVRKRGKCKQRGPALTYRTMNSQMEAALICTYAAARMMRMVVMMMKPASSHSRCESACAGSLAPARNKSRVQQTRPE